MYLLVIWTMNKVGLERPSQLYLHFGIRYWSPVRICTGTYKVTVICKWVLITLVAVRWSIREENEQLKCDIFVESA